MNPMLLLAFLITCFISVLSIYLAFKVSKDLRAPEILPLVIVLFGFLIPVGVFIYGVTNLKEAPKTDNVTISNNRPTSNSIDTTIESLEKENRKTSQANDSIPKTGAFNDDFLVIDFDITGANNLEKAFKDKVKEMDKAGYDFHKFNYDKPKRGYVLIFKKKTGIKEN